MQRQDFVNMNVWLLPIFLILKKVLAPKHYSLFLISLAPHLASFVDQFFDVSVLQAQLIFVDGPT